ncbi:MAG: AAA family ATPase, partial [Thermomicrobiales bacterium]|nr:AAA family ATPase [Thermomicrobiales bacterium]
MVETLEQPALIVPIRPPRLTRLEAHGFKSFANRTSFRFEPGITAVVGPNGSGKSNVADAVRWVLGEQGVGALRARRSDDVIFAGGQGRAPASMAEASLTFDNADGWLPIDFAEVTVTRRAFRGGENHYLINGKRVRLKDVAHLAAGLGHSHVVVGQGLVDAALSQRPEERRALFEHAADLAGLRLRVAEAGRNLTETESNSARVDDLLTELEPRLALLRRAARQAADYRDARTELQTLQRGHLAGLLRTALAALDTARTQEAVAAHDAAAVHDAVQQTIQTGADARTDAETARVALERHETTRRDLDERSRRRRHERDLACERAAALDRRRQDMADTQQGLDEQAAAVAADLDGLACELATLAAELAATGERSTELTKAVAAARAERARLERAVGERDRRRAAIERDRAAVSQRNAVLTQKREGGAAERERLRAAETERAERVAALETDVAAAETAASDEIARLATLDRALADLTETERRTAADLAATADRAAAAERALHEATARLTALRRLHESGAGLHAGVRATLAAAATGALSGVLGTVAESIAAPADLDTAIEVALGSHLQDIIVRRWRDAEAAIAYLKRGGAGRATFQPLETVTTARRAVPERALAIPGVRGVAADLVRCDADRRVVVDALLGRTLVVDDLPAARAVLPLLAGGWSTVTLGGEIARSGGSVTGGAAVRESGMLGRERELRELPTQVEALRAKLIRARDAKTAADATGSRLAVERRAIEAQRAAAVAAGAERTRQQDRLVGWLAGARREADATSARLATLDADANAITVELVDLERRVRALDAELTGLGEERRTHAVETERAVAALRVA